MLGDLSLVSRRMGAMARAAACRLGARQRQPVDPSLWRANVSALPADAPDRARRDGAELDPAPLSGGVDASAATAARAARGRASGMQLYDLRPAAGVVPVSQTP